MEHLLNRGLATRLNARAILTEMVSPSPPFPPSVAARPRTASILINNFNYGRFVGEAIESALGQTHGAEVIVVDDGSTDDSRQVIDRFGSRVLAIFKSNGGHGSAMNTGFAVATGDLIIFLDSDDRLEPTAVATLLREWQSDTVMAQYPLRIVSSEGEPVGLCPDPPTSLSHGDVREQLLETGSFGVNVTSGLAFSRHALARIMPLPEEDLPMCADGYLVRAVAFLGPVQRLDVTLGVYRVHDRNFSNLSSTPGGLADGFRKKILYAEKEFGFTRQFSAEHGLAVRAPLEERNPEYAGYRLFLRLTDPAAQDVDPGEGRWQLLARYVGLRWRSEWPFRRRLVSVALATAAALSPAPVAFSLVSWLHDANDRPDWWRRAARTLRGA